MSTFTRNTDSRFALISIEHPGRYGGIPIRKVNEGPLGGDLLSAENAQNCRTYLDPDNPEKDETLLDAEIEVPGDYDGNPT